MFRDNEANERSPIAWRGDLSSLQHVFNLAFWYDMVVKERGKKASHMLVSTKGRYALRVVIDLAQHQAAGRTPLKKIAARQGISEKYLENILAILVRNGMLSGMRGKGGGYCLTRPADQYTVGEILRLTEGSLAPVSCLVEGAAACDHEATCTTLGMWTKLHTMINEYLDSVTVADLVAEPQSFDYVI